MNYYNLYYFYIIHPNNSIGLSPTLLVLQDPKLGRYWLFTLIWLNHHNQLCSRMRALSCIPCSVGFRYLQTSWLWIPLIFTLQGLSQMLPSMELTFSMEPHIPHGALKHISFSWVFWLLVASDWGGDHNLVTMLPCYHVGTDPRLGSLTERSWSFSIQESRWLDGRRLVFTRNRQWKDRAHTSWFLFPGFISKNLGNNLWHGSGAVQISLWLLPEAGGMT